VTQIEIDVIAQEQPETERRDPEDHNEDAGGEFLEDPAEEFQESFHYSKYHTAL